MCPTLPRAAAVALVLLALGAAGGAASAPPQWKNTSLPFAERADDLVASLTILEKLSQMDSNGGPIPRLNISAMVWGNECLHGVVNRIKGGIGATVFPQPIALAATFDKDLVHKIGIAIGDEGRALNNAGRGKFLSCWAPNMNIVRDPRWGRGCETFGEDPVLTSSMAVAMVTGHQGNSSRYLKVVSTCKHYAG